MILLEDRDPVPLDMDDNIGRQAKLIPKGTTKRPKWVFVGPTTTTGVRCIDLDPACVMDSPIAASQFNADLAIHSAANIWSKETGSTAFRLGCFGLTMIGTRFRYLGL
ncbi:MAG: hypothetical protein E5W59_00775 [Mesorhizobium sp.]|uniref:hypothetical protein n=1 Tax=Mesorhizobium sp. M4A.F.Ca.ET.050.02.1.1 TaxID=2496754 RepID=UPI000FC9E579|nr:hypothetical protein [Mesorhizobium sp. M4A.F.Ca.ET.050.02.1.1]TIT95855.1 MAG: hypothetical protein E5W59_00775 [Mesorhizobium sp.]